MILVFKNGVLDSEISETQFPAISKAIDNVSGGAVGIVFRDTLGNLISYVKETGDEIS